MIHKTHASKAVEAADIKARYDTQVKYVLKDPVILANIVKNTVSEVKEYSIDEIVESIEGEPEVEAISIDPGLTNRRVTGYSEEENIPGEGGITFDIRFSLRTLDMNHIRIIVNVEAQNDYYPGYDIVTRGIFYCSRLISAQKESEFFGEDYNNIKKVYSIWICMDVPKKMIGTKNII